MILNLCCVCLDIKLFNMKLPKKVEVSGSKGLKPLGKKSSHER